MTDKTIQAIEQDLWKSADQLRANSHLNAQEYSFPVLGLIFLKYADTRFTQAHNEIEAELAEMSARRRARVNLDQAYKKRGVMFVPETARYSHLLNLPEKADIGKEVNSAMTAIEESNPRLNGVLPKTYNRFSNTVLSTLLKQFDTIPMDIEGDVFGRIYEYFLGEFARSEGQRGGQFFTPTALVKLIVEIIEPYTGRILDPACGSGGMFVQSARFMAEHAQDGQLSIYGQERVEQTIKLCQMNLAVHQLEGDVRQTNSYYEDPFNMTGQFDYVMANPPFNVNAVDKDRLENDPRYPLGMPSTDNGNYLWIQMFYAALNERGRAGFVMANSASDARHSEQTLRQQLLEAQVVDVMVAIGSNFFYTVTLPCTLWFLDKGKQETDRADKVLFIDARRIYRQVDRAHRDFTDEQLQFVADIARLYRGEAVTVAGRDLPIDDGWGTAQTMADLFPDGVYADVAGLCKVATLDEIQAQGYSLNPGRYVGVTEQQLDDVDFYERMGELQEEFELLTAEAHQLEQTISDNLQVLMGH